VTVDVAEARLAALAIDHVDHERDALLDREGRACAAHVGTHPAGRDEQHRPASPG